MNEFLRTYEIRWSDIDANGHVNYAAYIDAAADLRYHFFTGHGFPPDRFRQLSIGPIYTSIHASFFREVRMGEMVTITYLLSGLSPKGMHWKVHHDVLKSNGKKSVSIDLEGTILDLTTPARIEALVTGPIGTADAQWQGICWYRRRLAIPADLAGDQLLLRFEGAMNVAEVWLDGERIGGHQGGYLPFVLDLTDRVRPGHEHLLSVRLDNRDNPVTGPKPLAQLDYNTYHGLYRPVELVRKNRLHLTEPILADRPGSGGVFVTFPQVTTESATVRVQAHVRNAHNAGRSAAIRVTLRTPEGVTVVSQTSRPVALPAGADIEVTEELDERDELALEPHEHGVDQARHHLAVTEAVAAQEQLDLREPATRRSTTRAISGRRTCS